MKVFKGTQGKSWALQLVQEQDEVATLYAVDSQTGDFIRKLIVFYPSGKVERREGAESGLKIQGYNPREHNNLFGDMGQIVID